MERKPLKRKPSTLVRKAIVKKSGMGLQRAKTPLEGAKKRKSPTVIKSLRTKTWELCKGIIRAKYGNTCYTCNKSPLSGSGWQTGHFIPRSICGLTLRYELRNLRPQCYRCNIDLGGNGSAFYHKLVEIEGQEYVDRLFAEKSIILKETPDFYFALIAEYKTILGTLSTPPEETNQNTTPLLVE